MPASAILAKAGAWVDGERVRLPSYMVKDALRKAPRSFTLWARDGNPKHNIHIGPGRAHFGPGPTCTHFIDPETLERRPYTKADVPLVARLLRVARHRGRRPFRPRRALRVRGDVPEHFQAHCRLVL